MNKYCRFLIDKSVLIALLLASPQTMARSLVIDGEARFADGKPVPIATVYVQELRQRMGAMPSSSILRLGITSRDGKFRLEVDTSKGDLFIVLIGDHCSWLDAHKVIRQKELEKLSEVRVLLSAERDACENYP